MDISGICVLPGGRELKGEHELDRGLKEIAEGNPDFCGIDVPVASHEHRCARGNLPLSSLTDLKVR